MALRVRTLALWCAVVACAAAYTVDCNHEYTDCDTELSKLVSDDEEGQSVVTTPSTIEVRPTTTVATPTRSTSRSVLENKTVEITTEQNEVTETIVKPKPRLLNLNVDELQNFANALHNQTNQREPKKNIADLSDVNMDGDDDDEPPKLLVQERKQNQMADKFYSNLQAPFHPLLNMDKSEEIETCKVNEVTYKLGEKMDRGCEETCECSPGGVFECSPRCKHPYIRRGRRLSDPLCFESPVDECCSIMACATNNGDLKPTSLEICRYGNDTYHVGAKWNIGCEQTCTCERNSVVTCKPRCQRIAQSDRCINVQDPNDACCEIQICDVSQDVHEEPMENVTVSTSSTTEVPAVERFSMESPKSTMRPLVLLEPIGSIKVLQNNSVQVNLIHPNDTEDPIHLLLSNDGGNTYQDVELRYSNLILNLEGGKDYILKTKETGTKFNFTITASDVGNELPEEGIYNVTKDGCYHDGQFYAVGEEFNIGCTELCECTGQDTRECAPLHCPNHVGLELVSKGCVKWAPSPPPQPPNCCPRTARCLSDGTCHYKGVAIPNWSEVPIALSGCEQHCFCENGELDCQEACSPLPPLPPQTLRCPPMHRPAPVNISSDEDCCKEWGCVPHAGNTNASALQNHITPSNLESIRYVTPITPVLPVTATLVLPTPPLTTEAMSFNKRLHVGNFDFYKRFRPLKSGIPKYLKSTAQLNNTYSESAEYRGHKDPMNITVFTPDDEQHDANSHFRQNNVHLLAPPKVEKDGNGKQRTMKPAPKKSHSSYVIASHDQAPLKQQVYKTDSHGKMHQNSQHSANNNENFTNKYNMVIKTHEHSPIRKVPISQVKNLNYFSPEFNKKKVFNPLDTSNNGVDMVDAADSKYLFEPSRNKSTEMISLSSIHHPKSHTVSNNHIIQNSQGKYVTILRNKDVQSIKSNAVETASWKPDIIKHLLKKEPNPYETVLLRALPNTQMHSAIKSSFSNPNNPAIKYSTIDLENILSQMEIESEVNRNLGRSAEKSRPTAAGQ
ncbi:uncharacterized protein LOC119828818 isoform X3 [Zerene cesonia]|uniref:uncharacterized protein LOC119828818 isoform X3 n=1 Tax=Zerene cesonia TaxID=33412 RepID=UPI0018E580C9|nr:uncharacterized protein LOC119828818 isoform X3 [Zerene cesonia]